MDRVILPLPGIGVLVLSYEAYRRGLEEGALMSKPKPLPPIVITQPVESGGRLDVIAASKALRMSKPQLYKRIKMGQLIPQKDGRRTYFTQSELQRYIQSLQPRE